MTNPPDKTSGQSTQIIREYRPDEYRADEKLHGAYYEAAIHNTLRYTRILRAVGDKQYQLPLSAAEALGEDSPYLPDAQVAQGQFAMALRHSFNALASFIDGEARNGVSENVFMRLALALENPKLTAQEAQQALAVTYHKIRVNADMHGVSISDDAMRTFLVIAGEALNQKVQGQGYAAWKKENGFFFNPARLPLEEARLFSSVTSDGIPSVEALEAAMHSACNPSLDIKVGDVDVDPLDKAPLGTTLTAEEFKTADFRPAPGRIVTITMNGKPYEFAGSLFHDEECIIMHNGVLLPKALIEKHLAEHLATPGATLEGFSLPLDVVRQHVGSTLEGVEPVWDTVDGISLQHGVAPLTPAIDILTGLTLADEKKLRDFVKVLKDLKVLLVQEEDEELDAKIRSMATTTVDVEAIKEQLAGFPPNDPKTGLPVMPDVIDTALPETQPHFADLLMHLGTVDVANIYQRALPRLQQTAPVLKKQVEDELATKPQDVDSPIVVSGVGHGGEGKSLMEGLAVYQIAKRNGGEEAGLAAYKAWENHEQAKLNGEHPAPREEPFVVCSMDAGRYKTHAHRLTVAAGFHVKDYPISTGWGASFRTSVHHQALARKMDYVWDSTGAPFEREEKLRQEAVEIYGVPEDNLWVMHTYASKSLGDPDAAKDDALGESASARSLRRLYQEQPDGSFEIDKVRGRSLIAKVLFNKAADTRRALEQTWERGYGNDVFNDNSGKPFEHRCGYQGFVMSAEKLEELQQLRTTNALTMEALDERGFGPLPIFDKANRRPHAIPTVLEVGPAENGDIRVLVVYDMEKLMHSLHKAYTNINAASRSQRYITDGPIHPGLELVERLAEASSKTGRNDLNILLPDFLKPALGRVA